MFNDSFKQRYTTIPFAHYSATSDEKDDIYIGSEISHNHKEAEIIIVRDGRVRVSINGKKSYVAKKGDLIFVNPYEYHSYSKFKGEAFSHSCICFDAGLLYDRSFVNDLEEGKIAVSSIIESELPFANKLFDTVANSIELCKNNTLGWELQVVGCLNTVFGILKEYRHIRKNDADLGDDFCKRILTIIEKNFELELSSGDLSKRLHVTHSYFCRKFKFIFGYSFSEYLCMYRIEKSKALLKSTSLPISEIAFKMGFSSFSYYSKMFKSYSKLTPTDYRSKHAPSKDIH